MLSHPYNLMNYEICVRLWGGERVSPLQNNGKFVPFIKFGLTNNRPQDNFIRHGGFHRLICSAS